MSLIHGKFWGFETDRVLTRLGLIHKGGGGEDYVLEIYVSSFIFLLCAIKLNSCYQRSMYMFNYKLRERLFSLVLVLALRKT